MGNPTAAPVARWSVSSSRQRIVCTLFGWFPLDAKAAGYGLDLEVVSLPLYQAAERSLYQS